MAEEKEKKKAPKVSLRDPNVDAKAELALMRSRHSVRQYLDKPIEPEKRKVLDSLAAELNRAHGLKIQIFYDEPECFGGKKARGFSGVRNYVSLVGPTTDGAKRRIGHAGEELVLKAQELGLNTCWVAITRGKSKAAVGSGEKEVCTLALGYGENQGSEHKSKSVSEVSNYKEGMPQWFLDGVQAALLAPTANNVQKFYIEMRDDGNVSLQAKFSIYGEVDLGIVMCHFERATGLKVLEEKA